MRCTHTAAHGEACLAGFRRMASPVVRSRRSAWRFLIGVGVATVAVCVLFATKSVTVKLLPFDNKSELAVVVDLPEGATLEGYRAHAVRDCGVARQLPEIRSIEPMPARRRRSISTGWFVTIMCANCPSWANCISILAPSVERSRSHAIALDLRARQDACPAGGHGRPRG